MKIRLMGSPDLVRAWRKVIESSFDAVCAEYPMRGSGDIRVYCDIDDRKAAGFTSPETADAEAAEENSTSVEYRGHAGARARWDAYYKEHPEKLKAKLAKGAGA